MMLRSTFDHSPRFETIAFCVKPIPCAAFARSGVETRMMNAVMEQTRNVSK